MDCAGMDMPMANKIPVSVIVIIAFMQKGGLMLQQGKNGHHKIQGVLHRI
jgi:hypothetical protein